MDLIYLAKAIKNSGMAKSEIWNKFPYVTLRTGGASTKQVAVLRWSCKLVIPRHRHELNQFRSELELGRISLARRLIDDGVSPSGITIMEQVAKPYKPKSVLFSLIFSRILTCIFSKVHIQFLCRIFEWDEAHAV